MVDFTESMLGIASPSVGTATLPSAGLTTMVKVVRGASGLSAKAVPVEATRPAVRASADDAARVLRSRTGRIGASSGRGAWRTRWIVDLCDPRARPQSRPPRGETHV